MKKTLKDPLASRSRFPWPRFLPPVFGSLLLLAGVFFLLLQRKILTGFPEAALVLAGILACLAALIYGLALVQDRRETRCLRQEVTRLEKFKIMINQSLGWETLHGPSGELLWINNGIVRLLGYTREEIISQPDFLALLIATEDLALARESMQKALHERRVTGCVCRALHKNGAKLWLNLAWQPLPGGPGGWQGVHASGEDITAYKLAEADFNDTKEQFEHMFSTSPDGTLITSLEGVIVNVNERFATYMGYTREALYGKSLYAMHIWQNPAAWEKFINLLKTQGHCENIEFESERKDGVRLIGLVSARIITLKDRPHIFSITRDITERKRAELFSHFVSDLQSHLLQLDDLEAVYPLVGEKIYELLGDASVYVTVMDDENQVTRVLRRFGPEGVLEKIIPLLGVNPMEMLYPLKDLPAETVNSYRSGKLEPCPGGLYDLLLRKVSKGDCEYVEKLLKVHGIFTIGFSWNNRYFGGLVIYARRDILGLAKTIEMLVGQAAMTLHRLAVEKDLRLRNIILSTQQEASIDGMLVVDEHAKILSINRRFLDMFGIPPEIAAAGDDERLLPEVVKRIADPEEFMSKVQRLYEARSETSQDEILLKDGRVFERYSAPMQDAGGKYYGRVWYMHDITQRRALYDQLYEAQKMESVGRLASGIAHEINTPTQYVGDNVHFLQDSFQTVLGLLEACARLFASGTNGLPVPEATAVREQIRASDLPYLAEEIPKAFQQTLDGIERISTIVRAMKEFAHPGKAEKTQADLNHAIESTLIVARNEYKYVADLVLRLDPELPLVPCLLNEFNQAILNLVVNSAHAIGELAEKAGPGAVQAKGAITVSTQHAGDWAEIRVIDTGGGIPEAIRSKIFEPFFTTKPVGKGSGQGLAICRNVIVEKHGGTLTVESQMGVGTTFVIRLPLSSGKNQADVAAAATVGLPT